MDAVAVAEMTVAAALAASAAAAPEAEEPVETFEETHNVREYRCKEGQRNSVPDDKVQPNRPARDSIEI